MLNPFMLFIAALALGFVVAEGWALVHWPGIWRWLAGIPLLLVSVVGLKIIADTSADPTSHNLWPFELLMVMVLAGIILGSIRLVHVLVTRARRTKEKEHLNVSKSV